MRFTYKMVICEITALLSIQMTKSVVIHTNTWIVMFRQLSFVIKKSMGIFCSRLVHSTIYFDKKIFMTIFTDKDTTVISKLMRRTIMASWNKSESKKSELYIREKVYKVHNNSVVSSICSSDYQQFISKKS